MINLKQILKLAHSVLIIYLTFSLYEINKTLPAAYVGIQIVFTLLLTLIEKGQKGRDWKQLFFSLSLIYALRPTELNPLRYLFLAKIFYIQKTLAEFSDNIPTGNLKPVRLLKVIFDFSRLTFTFYMVLGVFIVAYKYWAYLWTDPQKTLSTHQIMYFFMITSSSIGYGDVTPKNQYQMYFLIAFIPILIIAFGQYFGKAVGHFDEFITILREESVSNQSNSLLNESIWGPVQSTNLTNYIAHAQTKNQTISQEKDLFANNWISLACKNSESHQPLLLQILDSDVQKQYKMLVASKLKRQFYPAGWTILEKGNTDKHILQIQQGQVEVDGSTLLGQGKVFNLDGFSKQEPSTSTYVTKTFTSVWAISVTDLVQIGKKSVNLQNKINRKLKQTRGEI